MDEKSGRICARLKNLLEQKEIPPRINSENDYVDNREIMKKIILNLIPFFIGFLVSLLLYLLSGWYGFWIIFLWIGGWISSGIFISDSKKGGEKDFGRKISILAIGLLLLIFVGVFQRENLQLEETVFYIASGIITRVLIHYAIAKVFGPIFFGRGFCGWACWTAAFLDWLPIAENKPVPKKYTFIRFPVFAISVLIPYIFITKGYDFMHTHIYENLGKYDQLIWFLVGNGIYYVLAIPLAFIFKKKRAFCKIICPVSLVMKVPTSIALLRMEPSKKECIECKLCDENCPMDVNPMKYIKEGKKITSTECILCDNCKNICPVGAIK